MQTFFLAKRSCRMQGLPTRSWATLQCDDIRDDVIQLALKAWFFHNDPLDEARGDMACMSADHYDRCVRPVRMRPGVDAVLDLDALHPTRDAYLLFYKLREAFGELHVLGILAQQRVRDTLHGRVSEADLVDARSRAVFAPRHLEREEDVVDVPVFALPFMCCGQGRRSGRASSGCVTTRTRCRLGGTGRG